MPTSKRDSRTALAEQPRCAVCGRPFEPVRPNQATCRRSCSVRRAQPVLPGSVEPLNFDEPSEFPSDEELRATRERRDAIGRLYRRR